MSSPAALLGINLDITLGSLLVGTYISVALFGFTTLQAYNYYLNFPNDKYALKATVVFIWVLEFVHVVFVTRAYYIMGVTNFGTFEDFIALPFTLKFSILWSTTIACMIQSFFASRIRVMSGRKELAVICWLLSIVRYVFALFALAEEIKAPTQIAFNAQYKWVITVVLATGMVNDLLIAAGLTFHLRQNRSGIRATDRIVNNIIKFTIQTGLITSILATAMLICVSAVYVYFDANLCVQLTMPAKYLTMPNNFVWLSIFVILARTYSNTFLASLNSRQQLRSLTAPSGSYSNGLSIGTRSADAQNGSSNTSNTLQGSGKFTSVDPIAIEMPTVAAGDSRSFEEQHAGVKSYFT